MRYVPVTRAHLLQEPCILELARTSSKVSALREALIAPQVDSSTKIKVVTAWYGGKCPPQD